MSSIEITEDESEMEDFNCDKCRKDFKSWDGEQCPHCGYVPRLDGPIEEESDEEEANEWFDRKHPNASCQRCEKKVTGELVVFCGGGGGACETWYCGECHEEGTHDCPCCAEEDCDIVGCPNKGNHAMGNAEYHYCDEHYNGHIVGECDKCGCEIHDTWDSAPRPCGTFCRPCGKRHDYQDEHNPCKECHEDDEEETDDCGAEE